VANAAGNVLSEVLVLASVLASRSCSVSRIFCGAWSLGDILQLFRRAPVGMSERAAAHPDSPGGGATATTAQTQQQAQTQKPELPCTGFLGAVQDFTGGESDQAWYDDVADNFVDTKDTVVSSALSTGLSMAGASTTAKSWGGVTLLQLGRQAWNANYGPVRTPGLWSFRTPTAALGTAAASWVVNAVLIKGAYNSGVLAGSLIRTGVNRAAGAMCARP
jgi:hypothetical protein